MRPLSLAVALTIAALPTGINAYLFAARYEAAVPEATSTILVSTLVSVVTLGLLLAARLTESAALAEAAEHLRSGVDRPQ